MFNKNSWSDGYGVAAGSVTGREHVRLHRNNQDGLALSVEPRRIVAAVCDGCSAGRSSEVGARLGAAFIAARVPRLLDEDPCRERLAERLEAELLEYLRTIAAGVGGGPRAAGEYLLFTLLVAVVEPERTLILGLGDGLYNVDGELRIIEPWPGNAPPYLAYRLVDAAQLTADAVEPLQVLYEAPTSDSLVLGSDGLAALSSDELTSLARIGERNPSLLQKRLNVWERRFSDDASAITICRRAEGAR